MMLVRLRMLLMTESRIAPITVPAMLPVAALQRGAADDHRSDRFELPEQPGGRRRRAEARNVKQRRHADADAEQHVGEDLDAVDVDRRIARHLLVRADRLARSGRSACG